MFEMETRKNILDRLKQYYTEIAGDKVNLKSLKKHMLKWH